MKRYSVHVISDAEDDLFDIYKYAARHDGPDRAEKLLLKLEEYCNSLSDLPERGHIPPEMERIGIMTYREIHFKPYRIIYQIISKNVYIHCVVDGRRDMTDFLQRRLLR